VIRPFGNSGAPRWYEQSRERFRDYLSLLEECRATAAEVVLHDGDADEFTSRVHVVRPDWEAVIRGYRDHQIKISVHGPLTPEFSPLSWLEEPGVTLGRYRPVLEQVAELADEQGSTTLVLHGLAHSSFNLSENERLTAAFLDEIAGMLDRWTDRVTVAIELRAYRHTRPDAAATTRASVLRVAGLAEHPAVGVCWDVAHDVESHLALGILWQPPQPDFLDRVRHLHLHDLGHDSEPHCPPVTGRVPILEAMSSLPSIPAIMEIRWRMAERIGQPWQILRESYAFVREGHVS
jgi:sugar phosphate isomerase/epimerase